MGEKGTGLTDIVLGIIEDCLEPGCSLTGVTSDTAFNHLNIDSLRMVQIVYEIEQSFAVELPEHALFQLETIMDLVNLVRLTVSACAENGSAYADQG